MTLPRSAPDAARRTRAVFLCVLRHVEELPWADCWFRAHPDSDLPRDAAAVTAEREVEWLREYYPLDMENKLAAHGLGFERSDQVADRTVADRTVAGDQEGPCRYSRRIVSERERPLGDRRALRLRGRSVHRDPRQRGRDAVRRETPRLMRTPARAER